MTHTIRWLIVAPLSVVVGLVLQHWNVPAAWILAGILVAGAMALITGEELPLNERIYDFGRGIIGILAALPLVGIPLADTLQLLPLGILVSFITLGIGVVGGLLLARLQPEISPETGVLSMLAGGASMIPSIAHDVGADLRFVSLAQYLRLLAVSVTLPIVSSFLATPGSGVSISSEAQDSWVMVLVIAAVAIIGGWLARLLRIPVPSVFGPLLLTVLISVLLPEGFTLTPPDLFAAIAFLTVGWACGGLLSVPALKLFASQLPATITFIIVVMLACAGMGWFVADWLNLTYFEGYLATSPGALETVLALGAEGGAGPEVVVLQLIRLIAVLLLAGFLPQFLRLLRRR